MSILISKIGLEVVKHCAYHNLTVLMLIGDLDFVKIVRYIIRIFFLVIHHPVSYPAHKICLINAILSYSLYLICFFIFYFLYLHLEKRKLTMNTKFFRLVNGNLPCHIITIFGKLLVSLVSQLSMKFIH